MNERKTYILKLAEDDEEKELQFELDYLATLSTAERLAKLLDLRKYVITIMKQHGHRGSPKVVKRT